MFKFRIAFGLALIVAFLTAVVGLTQGARPLTLLFRTFVSLAVFGLGGYLLGTLAEIWLARRLAKVNAKGQKVDIIDKDSAISVDELINPSHASPQFNPFVPDNFDRISTRE